MQIVVRRFTFDMKQNKENRDILVSGETWRSDPKFWKIAILKEFGRILIVSLQTHILQSYQKKPSSKDNL